MAYLLCKKCNKFTALNSSKYRMIGLGLAGFGIFGWFSFLFAGSGNAFLIACAITLCGVGIFYYANDLAKNSIMQKRCTHCNKIEWDDIPYSKPVK